MAIRHEEYEERIEDRGWMTPVQRLLMRLDELDIRLREMTADGTPYSNGRRLTADDLRYCLPEQLASVYEVRAAIELAEKDLAEKHGIRISEPGRGPGQMTIEEFFAPVFVLSPYEAAA